MSRAIATVSVDCYLEGGGAQALVSSSAKTHNLYLQQRMMRLVPEAEFFNRITECEIKTPRSHNNFFARV